MAERFARSDPSLNHYTLEIAPVLDEAINDMERRLPKISEEVHIETELKATGFG